MYFCSMRFNLAKLTINSRLLKPVLLVFMMLFFNGFSNAQKVINAEALASQKTDSLPEVIPCAGDSLVGSFVIFIRDRVKKHLHVQHSEHVYILEGFGRMQLGDSTFEIRPGMLIFIPAGTIHSVKRKGKKALKVLSIQAPRFDGTDRVWKE